MTGTKLKSYVKTGDPPAKRHCGDQLTQTPRGSMDCEGNGNEQKYTYPARNVELLDTDKDSSKEDDKHAIENTESSQRKDEPEQLPKEQENLERKSKENENKTETPKMEKYGFVTQPPMFPMINDTFNVNFKLPGEISDRFRSLLLIASVVGEGDETAKLSYSINGEGITESGEGVQLKETDGKSYSISVSLYSLSKNEKDKYRLVISGLNIPELCFKSLPFRPIRHRIVFSEKLDEEWLRDQASDDHRRRTLDLHLNLVSARMKPVIGRAVKLDFALFYENGKKVQKQSVLDVESFGNIAIDPDTGTCVVKCRITEVSSKHLQNRFCIHVFPSAKQRPHANDVAGMLSNPVLVKSKIRSTKQPKETSDLENLSADNDAKELVQSNSIDPAKKTRSDAFDQGDSEVLRSLGSMELENFGGLAEFEAETDQNDSQGSPATIDVGTYMLHRVRSYTRRKSISGSRRYGLEFVQQPLSFPFAHCKFSVKVCVLDKKNSSRVLTKEEVSKWRVRAVLVHEREPNREVGVDEKAAGSTQAATKGSPDTMDHLGNSSYQIIPSSKEGEDQSEGMRIDDNGLCCFQVNVDIISGGSNDIDRFMLKVAAYANGITENQATSVKYSNPIKVVRHQLVLTQGMEKEWMRDKGGKHNSLDVKVILATFGSIKPVLRRPVPLKLQLYYENGERVPKQSILDVDDFDSNCIDPTSGSCSIRCRIREVSFKHRKRRFRIRVGPDIARDTSCYNVAPAMTNPFFVKSKINAHRIRAKELAAKKLAEEAISNGIDPNVAAARAAEMIKPFTNQGINGRGGMPPLTPAVVRLSPRTEVLERSANTRLLGLGAVDVVADSTTPQVISAFGWPELDPKNPADALALSQFEESKENPQVQKEEVPELPGDTTSQPVFRSIGSSIHRAEPKAPITSALPTGAPQQPDIPQVLSKENILEWLPLLRQELDRLEEYDRAKLEGDQTRNVNPVGNLNRAPSFFTSFLPGSAPTQFLPTTTTSGTMYPPPVTFPTGQFFNQRILSFPASSMTYNQQQTIPPSRQLKNSSTINSAFLEVLANTASQTDPDDVNLPGSQSACSVSDTQTTVPTGHSIASDSQQNIGLNRTDTESSSSTVTVPVHASQENGISISRDNSVTMSTTLSRQSTFDENVKGEEKTQNLLNLSAKTLEMMMVNTGSSQAVEISSPQDTGVSKVLVAADTAGLPCFNHEDKPIGYYRLCYKFEPFGENDADVEQTSRELLEKARKQKSKRKLKEVQISGTPSERNESIAECLIQKYGIKGEPELYLTSGNILP